MHCSFDNLTWWLKLYCAINSVLYCIGLSDGIVSEAGVCRVNVGVWTPMRGSCNMCAGGRCDNILFGNVWNVV